MGDPAELVCLLQYRVEYRCEIAGGGINYPQNLGGCGLQLQCLLCLVDEPRVLHRDNRLGCEVLQQGDLLIAERVHLQAISRDVAKKHTVLSQRREQRGTNIVKLDECTRYWQIQGSDIRDVD